MDEYEFDEDESITDVRAQAARLNRDGRLHAAAAQTIAMRMRLSSGAVEQMETSSSLARTLESMLDIEGMQPRMALMLVLNHATDSIEALCKGMGIDPLEYLTQIEAAVLTEDQG